MYVFLYYMMGYRKKVITDNIRGSFPNKSPEEITKIVRDFYKHFCDLVIETIKNFTISKKQVEKRVVFENLAVLDELYAKGRNIVSMTSHYCNWELLAVALGDKTKQKQFGIYKPLKNGFFDTKMKQTREKFGLETFAMSETIKFFKKDHEKPVSIFFASDQWPSNPKRAYWTTFLERDTPVLFGAEQYAKLFDWAVVYCEMRKTGRGYYSVSFKLLAENPTELKKGEVTDLYCNELEQTINKEPSHWLWSHKRWKQTKKEVFKS